MTKLLFKTVFGSHLYGTDTPKSDNDFRGVFIPTTLREHYDRKNSIFERTKKYCNAKNTSDDLDVEFYNLKFFMEMATDGKTPAVDMLHSPKNMWCVYTPIWEFIHKNRSMFYSKKMISFVGYAQQQAAKYGLKGSRLHSAMKISDLLHSYPIDDNLNQHDEIPTIVSNIKHAAIVVHTDGLKYLTVCDKMVPFTSRIKYACDIVDKFIEKYGGRAKQALVNEGVDWKAISHAFRSAFQIKELVKTNDLKYPLKDRNFLIDVKLGKYTYNDISKRLEDSIDEARELIIKSSWPETCRKSFWDNVFFTYAETELERSK